MTPPTGSGTAPAAAVTAGAPLPAVIAAAALTKVYPGDVTALGGLTVDFAPGVTGLIGAHGAGKSPLLKLLRGLVPPTPGCCCSTSPPTASTRPAGTRCSS